MDTIISNVITQLSTEEQLIWASAQHLNIVQVSFSNMDLRPIILASKKPIDDKDVVKYVKDLGLTIDKLRIDHWEKK